MLRLIIVARPAALTLITCALLAGCGSPRAGPSSAPLVPIGSGLRAPAGLTGALYARGVPHVAALARDAAGRLWAAAAGLSDHRGDGVYVIPRGGGPARRVISRLDDPLGLLWLRDRLYVASVGQVTAYSGFDGRRFRHATVLIRGPVPGGENNGLALAPGGRLVMGITASCDHCRPRSPFSGALVSFRSDGRGLGVYASRIRAPVGLAFIHGTNDLLVTLNQRDDLGPRTTGDALALVRAGSSWRFPECYQQGGSACAGVPAPIALLDKHAAVGPIVLVNDARLTGGAGSRLASLVSEWQTGKIVRIVLKRTATGYAGLAQTWLAGLRNPLALLADRGAVLVGDWATGIVYRVAPRR